MRVLIATALVLLLAGCGGGTAPGSLSARVMVVKIPGCAHPVPAGSQTSVFARQEVLCRMNGGIADLATFTTSSKEQRWIASQGAYNASCCVQGHLWAATVSTVQVPADPVFSEVTRALGGRHILYP